MSSQGKLVLAKTHPAQCVTFEYCLDLPFVFQGDGSLTVKGFTKHEFFNIHFVNCMFVSEGGGTLAIFMYYWMNSGNIHVLWAAFMYCYRSIHVLLEL